MGLLGRLLRFLWARWADYNSVIAILELLDWKTGLAAIFSGVIMMLFSSTNMDWSAPAIFLAALAAAAFVSIIVIAFRLLFGMKMQSRTNSLRQTASIFESLDEIQSLFNSWIYPAAQNINQVLQRIMHAMRIHADPAVKSHEALIQRSIVDEERAALSHLSNALRRVEPTDSDDLQHRVGGYYRAYQSCRTWVVQGIKLTGIDLRTDSVFQEWIRLDGDLLRELRRFAGPARYDCLRGELESVGWGENITRDLREII